MPGRSYYGCPWQHATRGRFILIEDYHTGTAVIDSTLNRAIGDICKSAGGMETRVRSERSLLWDGDILL